MQDVNILTNEIILLKQTCPTRTWLQPMSHWCRSVQQQPFWWIKLLNLMIGTPVKHKALTSSGRLKHQSRRLNNIPWSQWRQASRVLPQSSGFWIKGQNDYFSRLARASRLGSNQREQIKRYITSSGYNLYISSRQRKSIRWNADSSEVLWRYHPWTSWRDYGNGSCYCEFRSHRLILSEVVILEIFGQRQRRPFVETFCIATHFCHSINLLDKAFINLFHSTLLFVRNY